MSTVVVTAVAALFWGAAAVAALNVDATNIVVALIAATASVANTILLRRARQTQKAIARSTGKLPDILDRMEDNVQTMRVLGDEREHHIVSIRRLVHRMENALDILPEANPDDGRARRSSS